MNPNIILLAGPPGAGKSTVARELVASSTGPTVCIEGDKFWTFFVKGGPNQVYSIYTEFYGDFDAPRPNLIADDTADPATVAALIREGLAEGRFRLPPHL